MPRYLVEGDEGNDDGFDDPPPTEPGVVIERGGLPPVTWIRSYVSEQRIFALYDSPSPEAARHAARVSGVTVRRVFEVQVLDPYAYHATPR